MTVLPPDMNAATFAQLLEELRGAVGADWLWSSDEDLGPYRDSFSPVWDTSEERHASAAVAPAAAAGPYQNSYADIEYMFARSAELGAAPSTSVFEPGFLRTTLAMHRAGRVPPGAMVKLYFGGALEFGLPPTATALDAYLELLEPSGLAWSVAVLGGDVLACGLAERAIRRGGHSRDSRSRRPRTTPTRSAPER